MSSIKTKYPKKPVEQWLNELDYEFMGYMPSDEALLFVNFIKEVNDGGEENETPLVHLKMMDSVFNEEKRCAILCHRGIGKTTVFGEYLILFIAAFGYLPGFGAVNLILYVTDSIENGVKNLRRNVEYRYGESSFLQKLIPNRSIKMGTDDAGYVDMDTYEKQVAGGRKFTDVRLEFVNHKGHKTIVKGYGSKTGVRGAKEMGQRPTLAILDDLVSDTDADSATIIATIENTVYKAVSKALSPRKQKMIWLGTPFNARDPLYKAVESGAWQVSVYPIAESFPVSKEEFKGSWADRFSYEYVSDEYNEAQSLGKPANFDQELMLRIMSDEDRMIQEGDIQWYNRSNLINNVGNFNFYITTDFATSEKTSSDFSVISVWAIDASGNWYWVDGICKRQLMDANVNDLFRLAQKYKPQQVGIEVSGQQGGFIPWIQGEMMARNIQFSFASDGNGTKPGIRPNTNKMVRFNTVLPWFKAKQMFFPESMKKYPILIEAMEELTLIAKGGMKSKHDDFIDTISMLSAMTVWRPSPAVPQKEDEDGLWDWDTDGADNDISTYVV